MIGGNDWNGKHRLCKFMTLDAFYFHAGNGVVDNRIIDENAAILG